MTESLPLSGVIGLGVGAVVAMFVLVRIVIRARQSSIDMRADGGDALVDLDFIDQLAAAAPPDRVSELFSAMADDCRACIDEIRRSAKQSDFDRIQEECASLADSCDAFGAKGLAGHARALKIAVQDRSYKDAGRLIVEIDQVVERTFRLITQRLKKVGRRRHKLER